MPFISKIYTVSTAGVMTEDGTTSSATGPSWTMGANGGAANTLGPEFTGNLLRHWSMVVEQVGGGTFNGIIRLQYKLDDGDAWTTYRVVDGVPTNEAVGERMHHMSAAGTFFETTGQTWLPVSAIKVTPANMGTSGANTTCRIHFHAEYEG